MAPQFVRPARAATSTRSWLATINYWRARTGLPRVTNNRSWDRGLLNHFIYMAETSAHYMTGQYASLHTENPASPYYTASGAKEAASSDLAPGASTDMGALDEWLAAPFHAIGMLRPDLTQVALAVGHGYGGLDVISGLNGDFQQKAPILYPGPGSTTSLLQFGGELPDPAQTCGWQREHRRAAADRDAAEPSLAPARGHPYRTVTLEGIQRSKDAVRGGPVHLPQHGQGLWPDRTRHPTGRQRRAPDTSPSASTRQVRGVGTPAWAR